jgi:dephospho-CoA kinase
LTPKREETVPLIGLTGGIGAGKTEVARILAELGCCVVNSDELAREALRDPRIKREIRAWWGSEVFDESGEIDRGAVAHRVFSDPGERKRLEGLTHPWIEAKRRAVFSAAPADTPAFVIDAPLLVEAGLDAECDAVIYVDAPRQVRLKRVMDSRGWSEEELARREAAQYPLDRKRKAAHHCVSNDGDRDALRGRVRRVLNEIIRIGRSGSSA